MNKRVSAIEEVELLPFLSYLTIRSLVQCRSVCEQYCLKWESCYLLDLGSILDSLWDGLVSVVAQEALRYTVLSGIVTALTCPASLLAVASVITTPGECGKWPVNLTGFSLGAHVIYFCLEELANDQGSEDAVLLGAPEDGSEKAWQGLSRVVAGKIVNGYSDWLLGFLYGSSSVQRSVAGLQPISSQDCKIINVDLSSVKGHLDYMHQMDTILVAVRVPSREEARAMSGKLQKDSENGWEIPDISDLLDSISECDGIPEPRQGNMHLPCALRVKDHF
uniref:Transmembrane and coiled-coil domains 4 n=1 Tax=Cyprinus carpio carpio TaxID=630221 RepID=A0A8C1BPW4_CYPCA